MSTPDPILRNHTFDHANMDAHQQAIMQMDAIASVYSMADSVLCSKSIAVQAGDFSNIAKAPAWSDGSTIYLNREILKSVSDDSIISLNGVNYHEVAHILYSPRFGTTWMEQVQNANLLSALNAMEDMRIETLLVGRYPSVRESLTQTVLTYLMQDESTVEYSYPLIRGRKYLPLEVRQASADMYIANNSREQAQALANVIDEYRVLSNVETDRGIQLLAEYARLLNESQKPQDGQGQPETGCNQGRAPMTQGQAEPADNQQDDAESAQQDEADGAGDESLDQPAGSGAGSDSGEQTDEDSDASGSGAGESDSEANIDENDSAATPAGNSNSGTAHSNVEQFKNAVNKVIEAIKNDESVKSEVARIREAIKDADGFASSVGKVKYTERAVSTDSRWASKAFADELTEMMVEKDSYWVSHQSSGRVNMKRAMNMDINEMNTVFDRWSDSQDAFDIECVILLDNSGSMDNIMNEACEATWAIKRALESIDAKVTVYSFSDTAELLYSADETTKPQARIVAVDNGTYPATGIHEAERILTQSRRATKILLTVSDGDWGSPTECHDGIKRINALEGAITSAVVMVDKDFQKQIDKATKEQVSKWLERNRHETMSVNVINQPRKLIEVAKSIVKSL